MSYHRAARATLELVQISLALSMIRDITITKIESILDRPPSIDELSIFSLENKCSSYSVARVRELEQLQNTLTIGWLAIREGKGTRFT